MIPSSLISDLLDGQITNNKFKEARALHCIGKILKTKKTKKLPRNILFFSNLIFSVSDCWIWTGFLNKQGFARLGKIPASRISYTMFKGKIPENMVVMHLCDVRSCVNPEHLILGTQIQNIKDCVSKNRHRNGALVKKIGRVDC